MSISYSDITFSKKSDSFSHNLDNDFSLFAVWKSARPLRSDIRELLASQFEVLLETEIEWSEENFHSNASRIYEAPMFQGVTKENHRSNHKDKIGDNTFILFAIKDSNPRYTYEMSVSKKIEISNINVVNSKRKIRDWVFKDSGAKYAVHSTNNIYEFFFQAPLLLGDKLFKSLLSGNSHAIDQISKDLEGANGWKNWEEVLNILNNTNNYVILRGFEELPKANPEKDIDLLTDNYQRVASALGVIQSKSKKYKGTILVNNEKISVDIRFIGDKYYDVSFEKDILSTKVKTDGFFRPRDDMYFFSLLYHCKVHKNEVKEKYVCILANLANNLNFSWYKKEDVLNDEKVGQMIRGYYQANNYYYEDPMDNGVIRNKNIIKYLPNSNSLLSKDSYAIKIKKTVRKFIPDKIMQLLIKHLKQ